MIRKFSVLLIFLFISVIISAQDEPKILLDPPNIDAGKSLMHALNDRRSVREFSSRTLERMELSNLLWAACGVNRVDGKRTAPTAMNAQEFDVYVVLQTGVYLYDPAKNELNLVAKGDFRKSAGAQEFVHNAPVNLIYVANFSKINAPTDNEKLQWANIDVGFMSENVYLFCSAFDMATVVRGSFDKVALSKALKLKTTQRIILAQTVGHQK